MDNRTRLLVAVAILAVGMVALAVGLGQCGAQPGPSTGTPLATGTGGALATSTAPGRATVEPGTPTVPPEPTSMLTEEQQLARELILPGGQVTYAADDCREILEAEPSCSVVESAVRITRPEWEQLFPETDYYLVETSLYSDGGPQKRNWLIVEQNGSRYTAESFDQLLEANGITSVTDENRELVAKAFALMTLADFLEDEIVFTELEQVDMQPARHPYNYCLSSWTRIAGLEVRWCFVFQGEYLRIASGPVVREYQVGDYVEVPPELFSKPSYKDYRFTGG